MTKIYKITHLSQSLDFCMAEQAKGIGTYYLSRGISVPNPPEDFREVRMTIDEDHGVELTDLLATTDPLLLMREDVLLALKEGLRIDPCEHHKFRLMNPRGRVHSDDYVMVNPIGTVDCLSVEDSDVMFSKGKILKVDDPVFKRDQLPDRDLFRVTHNQAKHYVTQNFVDFVAEKKYTNFIFHEIPLV